MHIAEDQVDCPCADLGEPRCPRTGASTCRLELAELLRSVGGECAVLARLAVVRGVPRLVELQVEGALSVAMRGEWRAGRTLESLGWTSSDLLPLNRLADTALAVGTDRALVAAGGLVAHQGRVLGWLGVLRDPDALPVGDRARRAFRRCRGRLLAKEGEGQTLPSHPLFLVVDAKGRPVLTGAEADRWLGLSGFSTALARMVREAEGRGVQSAVMGFGAAMMELECLRGEAGPRYLVRGTPGHALCVPPAAELTSSQLEVASFAAAGATVAEIARAIERSPETVRTHLKHAYARLEVASRVELAQALDAAWAPNS